jgi:hypothetical protein
MICMFFLASFYVIALNLFAKALSILLSRRAVNATVKCSPQLMSSTRRDSNSLTTTGLIKSENFQRKSHFFFRVKISK